MLSGLSEIAVVGIIVGGLILLMAILGLVDEIVKLISCMLRGKSKVERRNNAVRQ